MIGIIDYNMGNLGSVQNACRFLKLNASLIRKPERLKDCDALILPGVGAFGDCMRHLREAGFVAPLRRWIQDDRPFLGICVGLQVLFEGSEESPGAEGLAVLPGMIRRFDVSQAALKVPQIGWNQVRPVQSGLALFDHISPDRYFYFVHSYYAPIAPDVPVAATTEYGLRYCSAIAKGRMMAVQFHPEKSQKDGLQLLKNFGMFVNEQMENR